MQHVSSQIASQTAASATISGHLFRASLIAKRMALAAKNSRAMVLRAGAKAAGLKVISDYFDELAGKTIRLSRLINQSAITISRTSVRQWRTQTFLDQLAKSQARLEPSQSQQLNVAAANRQLFLSHQMHSLQRQLIELKDQLADIHQYMQSSNVVAVTFRLEATQTGEFRPMLENMAETISQQSNDIKEHITTSQNKLSYFQA